MVVPDSISYRPSLVSFLDILGFRELLASASADDVAKHLLELKRATQPIDQGAPDDTLASEPKWFQVSDAIVRIRHFDTQYKDGALYYELSDLGLAQASLAGQGVFIRGGLAIGDAAVGTDEIPLAFGPAVADAYELEAKLAVYPRIVISQKVIDQYRSGTELKAQQHSSEYDEKAVLPMIRSSSTGPWLDYMSTAEASGIEFSTYLGFCNRHKEQLARCLSEFASDPRKMEKYLWLASYHNCYVRESIVLRDSWYPEEDLIIEKPFGWDFPSKL